MRTVNIISRGLLALLCAGLVGCGTRHPLAELTPAKITELDLVTMPVAVNLENQPGVDGVPVKLYAVDPGRPKTQSIRAGTLEFMMFDGIKRSSLGDTNATLRVWTFDASQLPPHVFETTVGTGYFFALNWGTNHPKGDAITLIARYRKAEERPVYSAPSYIAVPAPSAPKK